MVPLAQTVSILLLALPNPASAFVFSGPAHQPSLCRGLSTAGAGRSSEDPAESAATSAFRASLKAFKRAVAEGKPGDLRPAVQLLVGDPAVVATRKDAADLLNGVPQVCEPGSRMRAARLPSLAIRSPRLSLSLCYWSTVTFNVPSVQGEPLPVT